MKQHNNQSICASVGGYVSEWMGERVRESDGDYVADEVDEVVGALVVVFLP